MRNFNFLKLLLTTVKAAAYHTQLPNITNTSHNTISHHTEARMAKMASQSHVPHATLPACGAKIENL
jgi:hypothetical protein